MEGIWPSADKWVVLVGTGNNGMDGLATACLAANHGKDVTLVNILNIDAAATPLYEYALQAGCKVAGPELPTAKRYDLCVDAVFGLGLNRPISKKIVHCIESYVGASQHSLSLDMPSGVCASTGQLLGGAVAVDATITFLTIKQGLFMGQAREATGNIYYSDLGLKQEVQEAQAQQPDLVSLLLPDQDTAKADLGSSLGSSLGRAINSHKGQRGHLLVVAGSEGMAGAAILVLQAALRLGIGYASLYAGKSDADASDADASCRAEILKVLPQVLHAPDQQRGDAVVIGPGIGQSTVAAERLKEVLSFPKSRPIVVDADALRLLPQFRNLLPTHHSLVLTPHSGEAGTLLGCTAEQVEMDRLSAACTIAKTYHATVVLKGPGSIVASQTDDGMQCWLCPSGNEILATGGSGDLLAGLIGALLARGELAASACGRAVSMHAQASDRLALFNNNAGMTTDQLLDEIFNR